MRNLRKVNIGKNIISSTYTGTIEIKYDERRTNGNWYLSIPVISEVRSDNISRGLPVLSRSLENIVELPINGPGISKARKKIRGYLRSIGYTSSEDIKIVINV